MTVDLGPVWNLELRASWFDSFFQIGDGILFRIEAFPVDMGTNASSQGCSRSRAAQLASSLSP